MKEKKICLILDLRMPMFLRDFTLLEIGRDNGYYDLERTENFFRTRYERSIRSLFDVLETDSSIKISVFFSGNFLKLLSDNFPKEILRLRKLIEGKKMEVIGGSFSNSLASMYSLDIFSMDIDRHLQLVNKELNVTPTVFQNTENIYSNNIAQVLNFLGFKATFSDPISWYLNGQHPRQIFKAPFRKKFRILIMEQADNLIPDNDQDQLKIVRLVPHTETQGKNWKDRLSELTSGHTSFLVEDVLTRSSKEPLFSAPIPIGGMARTNGLDGLVQNPMQKKALETIFSMEREVLASNNEPLIHDWMGLCNVEYLIGMNPQWVEGSRPYDIFIRYMNILTDIKLRVS
jgi:alpha-amylase